ncbi:MAG: cytidylate kinase family protein [Termitinemataceae bacterium]|nr:MAG: cytidylate kinase family protein [Termitinemataceae bacterium]
MGIITISRELAALGDETAKELSKRLGWRYVDKWMLEERIRAAGELSGKFEKYDERKPSFFASISEDRDEYLHFLKTAILDEAAGGDCIFMGRGAFAVLEGVPGVLSIFLVSSMKARIARVKSYFHCDEKRAKQLVSQSDNDRSGFHKFFFEKEWKDPDNYHLTFNTSNLHPELCAELIKGCTQSLFSGPVNDECSIILKDMSLARKVVHYIRYERKIGVHFLDVTVSCGKARLHGVANSALMADTAMAAAAVVPGISSVQNDIQIVQEYTVRPYKI